MRGGQTTMWIQGSGVSASRSGSSGGVGLGAGLRPYDSPVVVPIDPQSGVSVTIGETGIARVEGELRHTSGLIMASHGISISLSPLTIAPLSPTSFQEFRAAGTDKLSTPTLIFPKANVQLHRERRQLVITCDFVMLSPEAARALGDPGLSQTPIGFVTILADVELSPGSEPLADDGLSSGSEGTVTAAAAGGVGPDIIVAELQNMANYGNMQVCRDSGEVCATDADCNACTGSGGPCLSNSDCKICSTSGVPCVTTGDCKTCNGSGMPCTIDAECGGIETCVADQDCVLSGDTCNITGDACDSQIAAFAVPTRSCNIGDEPADWISFTSKHPVISQNLFRLKDDRFEQVGMAWVKHGFFAVTGTFCGPCTVPPGSAGSQLGVGCSDPYSATLNGQQSNLGPRSDINAHTGEFPYPFEASEAAPTIGKRIQVRTDDLDLALNSGATYFVEGHYVAADDAFAGNGNNNASYRRFELSQEADGRFVFSPPIDPDAVTQQEQCGIRAWQDQDPSVVEVDVQIPGEGLFVIAAKATDLGTGIWQYEYAIQNLNSDRSGRSLEIPLPTGAVISEVGFHDLPYHSGETYDGTDWTATVTDSMIKWSTASFDEDPNANALRWGTLYNFRFRANVPPTSTRSGTTITLGLFKPGLFDEVTAITMGPAGATIDCNDNGFADACDLDCNMAGCEWPCGGSTDCNGNGVPDDCELDCNGNGIADTCDIASGLSQDCNTNTVPDECEPDCDGDSIPDDCDTFDDTDGDGVVDCDDLCPLTSPPGACQCPETGRCCFTALFCLDDFPLITCEADGGTPDCRVSQLCRDGCLISDVDNDGDIDLFDLAGLQQCFSGSKNEPGFVEPGSECLRIFDGISDGAVDLEDYGLLRDNITGP
ncbi:MAG: hypothetical protein IIC02_08855 [Planctomycetes bacterium]|nr:hypothetical protein [Planctomycetota bacterium]